MKRRHRDLRESNYRPADIILQPFCVLLVEPSAPRFGRLGGAPPGIGVVIPVRLLPRRTMDLQELLLEVGNSLRADEVRSLAFLCADLLGRDPASVGSAADLFTRLVDLGLLSPEDPHLLRELLLVIKHLRLVHDLQLPEQAPPARNLISSYRKLLYDLSENITDENLRDVKFLLYGKLPRKKLMAENTTMLDVLLLMERMDLLSEDNLGELEVIVKDVCPALRATIQQFKTLQAHGGVVAQESPPTDSLRPHQVSASSLEPGSPRDAVKGRDEREMLTHKLSSLSTETGNPAAPTAGEPPERENGTAGALEAAVANADPEGLATYPMTSATRGVCLIVNNYNFMASRGSVREGTTIDQKALEAVFRWLGFQTQVHQDRGGGEMRSLLGELSRRDHSQMDCLVCCVLSHGTEGGVCGVDGGLVGIDELLRPFDGLNCPSLADKPKMFFIQACRGAAEQGAVVIHADGSESGPLESDAQRIVRESIPADADFLLGMSTVHSFSSFRTRSGGSWFIQSLCQNLVKMVPRGHDLVSILTKVNAEVSRKSDHTGRRKQMPQPAFSLRKRVVFPVPSAPPPNLSH